MSDFTQSCRSLVKDSLRQVLKPQGFKAKGLVFSRPRGPLTDHIGIQVLPPFEPGVWRPSLVMALHCVPYLEKAGYTWGVNDYMLSPIYGAVGWLVNHEPPMMREVTSMGEAVNYAMDIARAIREVVLPFLEEFEGPDSIANFFIDDPRKRDMGWKGRQLWDALAWLDKIDPEKEPFREWAARRDEERALQKMEPTRGHDA